MANTALVQTDSRSAHGDFVRGERRKAEDDAIETVFKSLGEGSGHEYRSLKTTLVLVEI
jgi:hypothetical protein